MRYPGDASLSREIQDRITGTFAQTLDLAEVGKTVEALLGCDFMLRLDPLFEPARTLQERVQKADGEMVEVADLRDRVDLPAEAADSSAPPEVPTSDLPASESDAAASEEDDRVQSLLDEGQNALEERRFQDAIDVWSRIFLIDIDNHEASRRIEQAQLLKAEQDRKLEERYNEAVALLEKDEREAAYEGFERVLELDSDHFAAREQMAKLRSPKPVPPPRPDQQPAVAEEPTSLTENFAEKLPRPPTPPKLPLFAGPSATASSAAEVAKRRPNLRFVFIGSLVLACVVFGALLLNSNWNRLFPNSDEEPLAAPRRPLDRIARITSLYERGDTDPAIQALEQILPDQGDYERAQLLLSEWKQGEQEAAETDADAAAGESAVAARQELIESAREAYTGEEYLRAARLFARASALAPLEVTEADLFDDAKRQLEPIAQMIDLYTQSEYDLALPSLWRYFEENPENRDVRQLLVNSHYNLAVRSLRRRDPGLAQTLIREAVKLDLNDAFAQRLLLFSSTYQDTPRDLLYDIFVDNLDVRQ